jgi:hypothetical protein
MSLQTQVLARRLQSHDFDGLFNHFLKLKDTTLGLKRAQLELRLVEQVIDLVERDHAGALYDLQVALLHGVSLLHKQEVAEVDCSAQGTTHLV